MNIPEGVYAAALVAYDGDPERTPEDDIRAAVDAAIAEYNALGVNGLGAKLALAEDRAATAERYVAKLAVAYADACEKLNAKR